MNKILEIGENINNSAEFRGGVRYSEPLKERTTMKTGGNAALFLVPSDESSLAFAVRLCAREKVRCFVLGGGSNLVFSDDGFDGAVISTELLDKIEVTGMDDGHVCVKCGAGTKTSSLVDFCCDNGFWGFETFAGLPGTIGGNLFMNARCYSKDVCEFLESADYIEDKSFLLKNYVKKNDDWDYKKSPFSENCGIILSAVFRFEARGTESSGEIKELCRKYVADRESKGHFRAPSAGSVFKNSREFGVPSGKLIDEAGLKGMVRGGAQVAPWHGNFIINNGDASSSDIEALVKDIQLKVKERTGFMLEPEIIFLK